MPINCPSGEKPRYRVKDGKQRLAFCGDDIVESKNLKTGKISKIRAKARKKKKLGT